MFEVDCSVSVECADGIVVCDAESTGESMYVCLQLECRLSVEV